MSRILMTCIIALIASLSANAAEPLPTVEILGKNYYMYEVRKGDSLFGISRAYGWNYDQLRQLNPKAVSPLPKGMKIYYPAETSAKKDEVPDQTDSCAKPLSHLVKRGETVYAISRMYGIPVEKIFELNQGSKEGIKEGATLRLDAGTTGDAPEYYVIKSGDTLYGVAKKNSTTVAEIMKKNPGVTEKNFKAGDTIRLPRKGEGVKSVTKTVEEERLASFSTYKVNKKDTWDTVAKRTGVDRDDIIEINGGSDDKPKNKSLLAIPNIEKRSVEKTVVDEDPRELSQEGIAEIYDDVHGIDSLTSDRQFKVALLLSEPASRKDLEFTRGFLTGIDRLKGEGIKIRLSVVNGNRPSTEVLTELSELDPDILFLTTEKGIPAYLSEYAEVSQTPTVNTFDVKNELYTRNPYIIQLLTPSNYFNDEIAARIKSDYGDRILIFVGDPDDSDQLAGALKELWRPEMIKTMPVNECASLRLDDDKGYLIYGYVTKKDDVNGLLDAVSDLKSGYPLKDISVIGRPSWIVYDEPAMEEKYHASDVVIPSRFYYDKSSSGAYRFEAGYKALFDRDPVKSFPVYAAVGHDVSMYFIPSLWNAGFDINMLGPSKGGVQSDFEIYRPGNWTGMLNPVVYLVRFNPDNTKDKIVVK